jgi:hypothetical protein
MAQAMLCLFATPMMRPLLPSSNMAYPGQDGENPKNVFHEAHRGTRGERRIMLEAEDSMI